MTTALKVPTLPGSGYPGLFNFEPPVFPDGTANLVGLFNLGASGAFSAFNFANPGLPPALVGAPTASPIGLTLTPTAYLDTGLLPTSAVSFIAVAKPNGATGTTTSLPICSTYYGLAGGDGGDLFGFVGASGVPVLRTYGTMTPTAASFSDVPLPGANTTTWNAIGGRIKASGAAKSYRSLNGAVTQGTESAPTGTRYLAARDILLGKDIGGSFTGSGAVAMVAIFNVDLTDAQFLDNFTYLRSVWGPAVGITTL